MKRTERSNMARAAAGVAVLSVLVAGASAQPERRPRTDAPPERAAEPTDRAELNADRVRARLVRLRDRIDEAIASLDAGASPRDLIRAVREDAGGLLGGRPDRRAPGPDGGPDRPGGDHEPARAPERGPEAVRALVAEHLPELHARMNREASGAPDLGDRMLERVGRRVGEVIDSTEGDPELRAFKLEELRAGAEVFRRARELRGAHERGEQATAEARAGVEEALGLQYEARLAVARAELDRVRDRLGRMERDVARMGERRDEEVGRMLRRVLAGPERDFQREPRDRPAPPDQP